MAQVRVEPYDRVAEIVKNREPDVVVVRMPAQTSFNQSDKRFACFATTWACLRGALPLCSAGNESAELAQQFLRPRFALCDPSIRQSRGFSREFAEGGQEQDKNTRLEFFHDLSDLDAIHPGKPVIHKYHVHIFRAENVDCFPARANTRNPADSNRAFSIARTAGSSSTHRMVGEEPMIQAK